MQPDGQAALTSLVESSAQVQLEMQVVQLAVLCLHGISILITKEKQIKNWTQ